MRDQIRAITICWGWHLQSWGERWRWGWEQLPWRKWWSSCTRSPPPTGRRWRSWWCGTQWRWRWLRPQPGSAKYKLLVWWRHDVRTNLKLTRVRTTLYAVNIRHAFDSISTYGSSSWKTSWRYQRMTYGVYQCIGICNIVRTLVTGFVRVVWTPNWYSGRIVCKISKVSGIYSQLSHTCTNYM